jgi:glycopeptide antibiotics resistance protein
VNFVVIKYFGDIEAVEDRIESILAQRSEGYWNISVIPFRSIISSIDSFIPIPSFGVVTQFFIGNILVFVPMGFMIPWFMRRRYTFFKTMFACFMIILLIETIQFVTCLGVADIDDVILNMIGCVIGYLVYYFVRRVLISVNDEKGLF